MTQQELFDRSSWSEDTLSPPPWKKPCTPWQRETLSLCFWATVENFNSMARRPASSQTRPSPHASATHFFCSSQVPVVIKASGQRSAVLPSAHGCVSPFNPEETGVEMSCRHCRFFVQRKECCVGGGRSHFFLDILARGDKSECTGGVGMCDVGALVHWASQWALCLSFHLSPPWHSRSSPNT